MIIQLNATEAQIKDLINFTNKTSNLADIALQLERSLVQSDDTQSHEIPEEGDNAIIKRFE